MPLDDIKRDEIAKGLAAIAVAAGRVLVAARNGPTGITIKPDGSPSTEADLAAEKLIVAQLGARWPGIPVVAEESAGDHRPGEAFFLVDPLDGTKDFIAGLPDFSVNIALVDGTRPVAAAVAAPAVGRIWCAGTRTCEAALAPDAPEGTALDWHPVRARAASPQALALVSRRHNDPASEACLAALGVTGRRTASSALKFCLIASAEADVYIRCGPTMEWDTAAGDHVLTSAGGCVVGPDRAPLRYGTRPEGWRNGPFAALGDRNLVPRLDLPSTCGI